MSIPPVAHFIWFGRSFPWLNWLAVKSAADRGGFERVLLHHSDDLRHLPDFRRLVEDPRVKAVPMDLTALAEQLPSGNGALRDLAARLRDPAMKADLARLALLSLHGGVYLDMDTVTLASLSPLLGAGAFCGVEHLCWPEAVRETRNPLLLAPAIVRSAIRDLMRRLPEGWRHFRKLEGWYPTAPNNAVLGAEPGHPLIAELIDRASRVRSGHQDVLRTALGPSLLQRALPDYRGADLAIHPPEVFYPLGPEISEHWFRVRRPGSRLRLDDVLGPNTRIVHWYASVRTKPHVPTFDEAHVASHADRQLLSALARACLGGHLERSAPRALQPVTR